MSDNDFVTRAEYADAIARVMEAIEKAVGQSLAMASVLDAAGREIATDMQRLEATEQARAQGRLHAVLSLIRLVSAGSMGAARTDQMFQDFAAMLQAEGQAKPGPPEDHGRADVARAIAALVQPIAPERR